LTIVSAAAGAVLVVVGKTVEITVVVLPQPANPEAIIAKIRMIPPSTDICLINLFMRVNSFPIANFVYFWP
jgi:hypothetical protein